MSRDVASTERQEAGLEPVYRKIAGRVMPFLILLFVLAWLDRVNVGFAKLQMSIDLGFSETVYGFGAGIFFLGYLLFEIPSNLLMERIGARNTIARITILWGLATISMMFVSTPVQFYTLRFLLGAFEAGLYPGVVLYLTYWFPMRHRAKMMGVFTLAVPVAGIFGGPFSGWVMGVAGGQGDLANWQWLFLLEGIPSIAAGLLTLVLIVDRPGDAQWLTDREKALVAADLKTDRELVPPQAASFGQALRMPQLWLLALICFCLVSANPTLGFWSPTIINGFGVSSSLTIGLLSACPYLVAIVGIVLVSRHSDRVLERRYHCAAMCLTAAGGLLLIGAFADMPVIAFVGLVIATTGVLSSMAPFWQIPNEMLAATGMAGGIALINSVGNLSGWFGPFMVGWLKDVTGSTASGLYVVAGLEVMAALFIVLWIPRRSAVEDEHLVVAPGVV